MTHKLAARYTTYLATLNDRREAGQNSLEYLGMALLAGVVLVAIFKVINGSDVGTKIGDAWNQTMKAIRPALTRERDGAGTSLSLIDRFLGNTAEGKKRATAAIDPIIHAFATLMSTGGEFLPRLGDALAKVGQDQVDLAIERIRQRAALLRGAMLLLALGTLLYTYAASILVGVTIAKQAMGMMGH